MYCIESHGSYDFSKLLSLSARDFDCRTTWIDKQVHIECTGFRRNVCLGANHLKVSGGAAELRESPNKGTLTLYTSVLSVAWLVNRSAQYSLVFFLFPFVLPFEPVSLPACQQQAQYRVSQCSFIYHVRTSQARSVLFKYYRVRYTERACIQKITYVKRMSSIVGMSETPAQRFIAAGLCEVWFYARGSVEMFLYGKTIILFYKPEPSVGGEFILLFLFVTWKSGVKNVWKFKF